MDPKRLRETRAGRAFLRHWVGIVLTLVSLIQALAFSELAASLPLAWTSLVTLGQMSALAHFILAFALVVRVFQTYILAALDYEEWAPSFFDLVVIFLVGAVEYLIFTTLREAPFSPSLFHARFAPVALIGAIGYVAALARYRLIENPDPVKSRSEIRLQAANLLGSLIVLGISMSVWVLKPAADIVSASAALICAVVLAWNTAHSLRVTFLLARVKHSIVPVPKPTLSSAQERRTPPHESAVENASESDAGFLAQLLFESFDYIFVRVLDTSPRLARRLLYEAVTTGGGYGSIGFRRFRIVRAEDRPHHMVGACLMVDRFQRRIVRRTLSDVLFLWSTFRTLGCIGISRAIENYLQAPRERAAKDASVITYLAVSEEARRIGVGTSLLCDAAAASLVQGTPGLLAHVREDNTAARQFFSKHGFTEQEVIRGPLDEDFGLGPQIEMVSNCERILAQAG